jgi:nucleolar protein 56
MLYLLFESSIGFSLFKLNSLDKVATKDAKVQAAFDNFQEFKKIVSLEASHLFHGHNVAWSTCNELKEGKLPDELKTFLTNSLPNSKKTKLELAVQDKNLAALLSSELSIKAVSGDSYTELFRGIRNHNVKFMSGEEEAVDEQRLSMANLGIGHAIARNNIKFDEKRQDKTIINSFSLLDQIRESYGWHFPELAKILNDNERYVRLVRAVGVS